MKRYLIAGATALLFSVGSAWAHHPAADIVDEEIYAMIDALVADTPHADLTFDDMGGGMSVMTVTAPSSDALADMLDDGALEYVEQLDGRTYVTIEFGADGTATLNVEQYR